MKAKGDSSVDKPRRTLRSSQATARGSATHVDALVLASAMAQAAAAADPNTSSLGERIPMAQPTSEVAHSYDEEDEGHEAQSHIHRYRAGSVSTTQSVSSEREDPGQYYKASPFHSRRPSSPTAKTKEISPHLHWTSSGDIQYGGENENPKSSSSSALIDEQSHWQKHPAEPSSTRKQPPKQALKHVYHDYANVTDPLSPMPAAASSSSTDAAVAASATPPFRKKNGGVTQPFPEKLASMLDEIELDEEARSIVSWLPHGRAFLVRKPKEFTLGIMPRYFKQTKLTSFQRQLNLYGFRRITQGPDAGAYYHEMFLRGRPGLCQRMVRQKVKGTGHKQPSDVSTEPNFYSMPPVVRFETYINPKESTSSTEPQDIMTATAAPADASGTKDETLASGLQTLQGAAHLLRGMSSGFQQQQPDTTQPFFSFNAQHEGDPSEEES